MDFKKNFIEDNEKMRKYLNLVNQIKTMDHKNLAKIHFSELIEGISIIKYRKSSLHQAQKNTYFLSLL